MYNFKFSNKRKVHQRMLNQVMRAMNKNIANDTLWKGRFIVRQLNGELFRYEDGSGSYYFVSIALVDKKTKQIKVIWEDANVLARSLGNSCLFWEMNKFITEDCDVWKKEDPRLDRTDYNKYDVEITGRYPEKFNMEPQLKVKVFKKG